MKNKMIFERFELKYLITHRQQEALLRAMAPYMVEDEYGHSSIRNIYLDTPDFRLIRRSLERPVYKEKVRIRSYGRAGKEDAVFVELKKKYQSVVYKRRLSLPQDQAAACVQGCSPWPDTQIGGEIAYLMQFYGNLTPAVFLSYERDAYHGVADADFRVTFDADIRFRRDHLTLDSDTRGTALLAQDQVLMELKVAGGLPLWMVQVLSAHKIFKTSFSKYGTAYQIMWLEGQKEARKYA